MRTTHHLAALAALSLGIAACTSTDTQPATSPMTPAMSQTLELPRTVGTGENKEVAVLLDAPHLKLVTITLRQGTPLPPHHADVPVTIQVLEGEGTIHVAGRPVSVSRGSLLVLAAGEEHDVVLGTDGEILLLVHYLRSAR